MAVWALSYSGASTSDHNRSQGERRGDRGKQIVATFVPMKNCVVYNYHKTVRICEYIQCDKWSFQAVSSN